MRHLLRLTCLQAIVMCVVAPEPWVYSKKHSVTIGPTEVPVIFLKNEHTYVPPPPVVPTLLEEFDRLVFTHFKVYLLDAAYQIAISHGKLNQLWKIIWSFDITEDSLMEQLFHLMLLPGAQLASTFATIKSLINIEPDYRMRFRDGFRKFLTIVIERDPSLSWLQFYVDFLQPEPVDYSKIY